MVTSTSTSTICSAIVSSCCSRSNERSTSRRSRSVQSRQEIGVIYPQRHLGRPHEMAETKTLRINGKPVVVGPADSSTPLLYLLRNDADLHGPHFGCGLGQCGACTIHVNGEA